MKNFKLTFKGAPITMTEIQPQRYPYSVVTLEYEKFCKTPLKPIFFKHKFPWVANELAHLFAHEFLGFSYYQDFFPLDLQEQMNLIKGKTCGVLVTYYSSPNNPTYSLLEKN